MLKSDLSVWGGGLLYNIVWYFYRWIVDEPARLCSAASVQHVDCSVCLCAELRKGLIELNSWSSVLNPMPLKSVPCFIPFYFFLFTSWCTCFNIFNIHVKYNQCKISPRLLTTMVWQCYLAQHWRASGQTCSSYAERFSVWTNPAVEC